MNAKIHWIAIIVVLATATAHADNPSKMGPAQITVSTSYQSHTATVKVGYRAFNRKAHGIAKETYLLPQTVLGTDGGVPNREFSNFTVELDGQDIPIPEKWYADCYEPNLASHLFHVVLGDELNSVLVFIDGSSGAGSYSVVWEFRKDGHHSRVVKISPEGPGLFFDRSLLYKLQPDKMVKVK